MIICMSMAAKSLSFLSAPAGRSRSGFTVSMRSKSSTSTPDILTQSFSEQSPGTNWGQSRTPSKSSSSRRLRIGAEEEFSVRRNSATLSSRYLLPNVEAASFARAAHFFAVASSWGSFVLVAAQVPAEAAAWSCGRTVLPSEAPVGRPAAENSSERHGAFRVIVGSETDRSMDLTWRFSPGAFQVSRMGNSRKVSQFDGVRTT
mmetsp:Transcript_674/g.1395  ORF Transcript_674/g.1395 Transcript_674/m.1395 type:complete len:203 (+) Transcript_674:2555-3163(+)